MQIVYREIKVTNGDGVQVPDSRIGEVELHHRDDGAYICWMEYVCDVGAIINGVQE